MEKAVRELLSLITSGKIKTRNELQRAKLLVTRKYGMENIPRNTEILSIATPQERKAYMDLLKRKPSRTLSGVSVIAVMTKPFPCPHGRCIYCPGGVELNVPQSYTGKEPATMRALQNNFDPFLQTTSRIKQLISAGHEVDKAEIIVMGGTFTSFPKEYQDSFVLGILNAVNGKKAETFSEAKKMAETAERRISGITFETRPDWCGEKEISELLALGATRVELGVQNPDDRIYKITHRGHTVKDVIQATRSLKDSGLKVCYHLMPGLPGSDRKKDIAMFREIFSDPDFRPDMLKIYPCLLVDVNYMQGSELHEMFRRGEFTPLTTEDAADIIAEGMRYVPPWVRIMRIQRDISTRVVQGVTKSNLRELVEERAKEKGIEIKEIRAREIKGKIPGRVRLKEISYQASGGEELFLSLESGNKLVGFLRLRFPYKPFMPQLTEKSAFIRELHIYGQMTPVGEEGYAQHRGFGEFLLSKAETIAHRRGCNKILVTSGFGVREYYRKHGYKEDGPYMSKLFSSPSA